ncbi:MAG: YraN family protein [Candidatus Doudnabacteria bacterium]|nr:YraN family protein [Candidatus Doudnabacteria bacterium]
MNLGQLGETLVAETYLKLGFEVLDRNYKFAHGRQMGELDLVVRKGNQVIFVEVKTRRGNKFGTPFDSVDIYKQRKLVKMVKLYLSVKRISPDINYRIDVAAVDIDNRENPVIILANAVEDSD